MESISVNTEKLIPLFKRMSQSIYDDADGDGLLPGISFRTFEDTAIKIFKSIHGKPNPHIIRSISTGKKFTIHNDTRGCLETNLLTTRCRCRLSHWIPRLHYPWLNC